MALVGKQRLDWLMTTHTHTHTHIKICLYVHIQHTDGILMGVVGKQQLDWLTITQTHSHTQMNIHLYIHIQHIHIQRTNGFRREATVGLADDHTSPRAEYAMHLFQNLFSFIYVSCRLLCHVIRTWHGTRMEGNTRRASFRTCLFGFDSFICAHSYEIQVLIHMSRDSLFQNLHLWDATHANVHMSFSQKKVKYMRSSKSHMRRVSLTNSPTNCLFRMSACLFHKH